MLVVAAAAAAAVVVVVRGGKLAFFFLLLELAPSAPTTPSTKGKRLGKRACIGRVAQGQLGGGMRVLGVFENWAGKYVCLK